VSFVDITVPGLPEEIGYYPFPGAIHISTYNDFIFIASVNEVGMVDISDITNPIELSTYSTYESIGYISANGGNTLYLGKYGSLEVLDFSNSQSMEQNGYHDLPCTLSHGMCASDSIVITARENCGLMIIEYDGWEEVAVEEPFSGKPRQIRLEQNFPNPFNPLTSIDFELISSQDVTLVVYNLNGQEIKSLLEQTLASGVHNVKFDAGDLPSGVYLYQLSTPETTVTRKCLVFK
jgi:hypothetical protein